MTSADTDQTPAETRSTPVVEARPAKMLDYRKRPLVGLYKVAAASSDDDTTHVPIRDLLRRVERYYIMMALEHTRGNKAKAAQWLGLKRTTLSMRVRAIGLSFVPPPGN